MWPTLYHLSDHSTTFLQIMLTKIHRIIRTSFNESDKDNPRALENLAASWKLAMKEEGNYSNGTCVVTTLEQIRRMSISLKKEG